MFEEDVCVNPPGVLDGRPNSANVTFSNWALRRSGGGLRRGA